MYSINREFGKQLKEHRELRKLNQVEFGKLLSYSQAEMSKIENGLIDITINQYIQIVESLEVDIIIRTLTLKTKLIIKHELL